MSAPVIRIGSRQRGATLVEMLIGMVIGLFIVGMTFAVYINSKLAMAQAQSVGNMQEAALYAMHVITNDIEHAGYVGLAPVRAAINGRTGTDLSASLPTVASDCGAGWAYDVAVHVQAIDNYAADGPAEHAAAGECFDSSNPARLPRTGTDVLMLRRADTETAALLAAGGVYLRSNLTSGSLFEPSAPPADILAPFEDRAWLPVVYFVRDYYLDEGDGVPSLRKLELGLAGGQLQMIESEVAPGVENMQLQFGLDSDDDGSVERYVDSDHASVATSAVKAVRVWLLVRAMEPDRGYVNDQTYELAGRSFDPANPDDNYMRQTFVFTVRIRN